MRLFRQLLPVLLLTSLTSACGSTGTVTPATATTPPPRINADPDSIRWVREAAEYRAALYQVYRQARARVDSEAQTHAPGTWAVVLDADETVINNSTYQAERARLGLTFTPESWHAWVERREATPLPGAADFLARVRTLGGRIAIVTNRLQSECSDTEAVFKTYALVYDAMLCRQDGQPSDKNPRFEAVAAGRSPAGATPLDIVAFMGDNILDFPRLTQAIEPRDDVAFSEFGVRFFVVPNPMYGSWQ